METQKRPRRRSRAHLYRQQNKHAEAILLLQQVYERFPYPYDGKMALVFIAICHSCLGQHEEAIRSYQKGVREYPRRRHLLEIACFSLGRIHMEQGQKKQALEGFESCLTANEEDPCPNGSRLKKAREYIVQIRGE